ncbi:MULTISPECIES: hypothetical protein [unclassified Chryseobacterium]|uniref:hypothetical protein n=1 Tax=unclassified Chryseobacterium TaxID=2593645 RepID=UPI001C5ADAC6|nr:MULTISPECIES: hypothetical protein [unclassified Chryseobacterium]MBW3520988.1 hypothetical protein [Chryseobacterium sp. NKUCC03_KSP]MCD0453888.1 hypothetical protein [Chryseobacterium sp. LC2016-27]
MNDIKDFKVTVLNLNKNYSNYFYNIIITYENTQILINKKRELTLQPKKIIFVKELIAIDILNESSTAVHIGFNEFFTHEFSETIRTKFNHLFIDQDFIVTDLLQDPLDFHPNRFKDYAAKNLNILRNFASNKLQSLLLDGLYEHHQNLNKFS